MDLAGHPQRRIERSAVQTLTDEVDFRHRCTPAAHS